MICTSWAWPNMFDVARNKVGLYSDDRSIINRVKLLMLTDPAELYMYPNYGVGLKKFMFMYANENTIALIRDKLIEQLRLWEPSVVPEETQVARGLQYSQPTNTPGAVIEPDKLNLTVTLRTRYGRQLDFNITDEDVNRS